MQLPKRTNLTGVAARGLSAAVAPVITIWTSSVRREDDGVMRYNTTHPHAGSA